MKLLRVAVRLPAMIFLLLLGLFILFALFPRWEYARQRLMIKRWSGWLLTSVGVVPQELQLADAQTLSTISGPVLLAANHVSWLDIFVINAIQPAHFVAKSDIRSWPLVGLLCDRSGTIFVERSRRTAVREVLQVMADRLTRQGIVAVFPEGTTGDMYTLQPFHSNFLQAAVTTRSSIVPLGITYKNADGNVADAVQFIGETTFAASAIKIMSQPKIIAKLIITQTIRVTEQTRHELCEATQQQISQALDAARN
jgi:1-acyl-sn-glycerol-3-phosphate acyltransferase